MQIKWIISQIDSDSPTGATITAEQDEQLVGVLTLSLSEPAGFVRSLFVTEAARGRGVGRRLLTRALQICHAGGRTGLALSVKDTNTAAQRLYQSFDFVPHAVGNEGYTKYIHLFR